MGFVICRHYITAKKSNNGYVVKFKISHLKHDSLLKSRYFYSGYLSGFYYLLFLSVKTFSSFTAMFRSQASLPIKESEYKFLADKIEIANIAYCSTVTHNYEDIPHNLNILSSIFSRPGVVWAFFKKRENLHWRKYTETEYVTFNPGNTCYDCW